MGDGHKRTMAGSLGLRPSGCHHRKRKLLGCSARRFARRGAEFIKLEVDETNASAQRFYARLGFAKKTEDRLHVLEQDKFTVLISAGEETT